MSTITRRIESHSPEIFKKTAIERGELVYIPQFLCQASLPKRLSMTSEWKREFNRHTYTILAPSKFGVPGGAYSRLILIRINTLAKFSDSQTIFIGNTAASLMRSMGLAQQGGVIREFKRHFQSCLNCVIHTEKYNEISQNFSIEPVINEGCILTDDWEWDSKIVLSRPFYEAAKKSVPTDWGAIKCLSPGTLRMDLFNFLVYRLYYLKNETVIPWSQLHAMFSSPDIALWSFKPQFARALSQARSFYQAANATLDQRGLILNKSQHLIAIAK